MIHGPTLQLLGSREPEIYGTTTLAEIDAQLIALGTQLGVTVECRQTNHEGEIVDWLGAARDDFDGCLMNPAAYSHTSVAIRDAIAASIPTVEVHLSQIYAREAFRAHSLTAPVAIGIISGFGPASYTLGLRALIDYVGSR